MKRIFLAVSCLILSFSSGAQTFNLKDTTFEVGDIMVGRNIFFEFNKWTLFPESQKYLDTVAEFLKAHSHLQVEIGVHTDFRGSKQYSFRLHQKRAEAITQYLNSKGVPTTQIIAKGYGEDKPFVYVDSTGKEIALTEKYILNLPSKEEQERAHQMNRRVEFKILATDYRDEYASSRCNMQILFETERNFSTLTKDEIRRFLSTFSSSCKPNAEYCEISNELLLDLLIKNPERVVSLLQADKLLDKRSIYSAIESPVHEGMVIKQAITAMEALVPYSVERAEILKRLQQALKTQD